MGHDEVNVGTVDRIIRLGLGVGLLAAMGPAPSLFFLGIAPLLSGLLGFCPVYFYAGLSTKGDAASERSPALAH